MDISFKTIFFTFLGVFFSFGYAILLPGAYAETKVSCAVTDFGNPLADFLLPAACPQGNEVGQKAVELARAQIGKTYVWAAPSRDWGSNKPTNAPSGFDCSGLTGWAWYWATDGKIDMEGQTWDDWSDGKGNGKTTYQKFPVGSKKLNVILNEIQPGDLLFWKAPGNNGNDIHHTAIYSGVCKKSKGSDCFIEAPTFKVPLQESHLSDRFGGGDPLMGFVRPVLK